MGAVAAGGGLVQNPLLTRIYSDVMGTLRALRANHFDQLMTQTH